MGCNRAFTHSVWVPHCVLVWGDGAQTAHRHLHPTHYLSQTVKGRLRCLCAWLILPASIRASWGARIVITARAVPVCDMCVRMCMKWNNGVVGWEAGMQGRRAANTQCSSPRTDCLSVGIFIDLLQLRLALLFPFSSHQAPDMAKVWTTHSPSPKSPSVDSVNLVPVYEPW